VPLDIREPEEQELDPVRLDLRSASFRASALDVALTFISTSDIPTNLL